MKKSGRISRKRAFILCVILLAAAAGGIAGARIYRNKHITKYDAFYTLFEQPEGDLEKRFVDFDQREEEKIYKEIIYKYSCEINGHPVTKHLSFFEEIENKFIKYYYVFDDMEAALDYAQSVRMELDEYYGEENNVTDTFYSHCSSLKELQEISEMKVGPTYGAFWDPGIDCSYFTEMTGMEYYRCDISLEMVAIYEDFIRVSVRYLLIPKFHS